MAILNGNTESLTLPLFLECLHIWPVFSVSILILSNNSLNRFQLPMVSLLSGSHFSSWLCPVHHVCDPWKVLRHCISFERCHLYQEVAHSSVNNIHKYVFSNIFFCFIHQLNYLSTKMQYWCFLSGQFLPSYGKVIVLFLYRENSLKRKSLMLKLFFPDCPLRAFIWVGYPDLGTTTKWMNVIWIHSFFSYSRCIYIEIVGILFGVCLHSIVDLQTYRQYQVVRRGGCHYVDRLIDSKFLCHPQLPWAHTKVGGWVYTRQ